jgi:hypothetical protein
MDTRHGWFDGRGLYPHQLGHCGQHVLLQSGTCERQVSQLADAVLTAEYVLARACLRE